MLRCGKHAAFMVIRAANNERLYMLGRVVLISEDTRYIGIRDATMNRDVLGRVVLS